MNDPIREQARDLYRTVRMLKDRLCQRFEARARGGGRGSSARISLLPRVMP